MSADLQVTEAHAGLLVTVYALTAALHCRSGFPSAGRSPEGRPHRGPRRN